MYIHSYQGVLTAMQPPSLGDPHLGRASGTAGFYRRNNSFRLCHWKQCWQGLRYFDLVYFVEFKLVYFVSTRETFLEASTIRPFIRVDRLFLNVPVLIPLHNGQTLERFLNRSLHTVLFQRSRGDVVSLESGNKISKEWRYKGTITLAIDSRIHRENHSPAGRGGTSACLY